MCNNFQICYLSVHDKYVGDADGLSAVLSEILAERCCGNMKKRKQCYLDFPKVSSWYVVIFKVNSNTVAIIAAAFDV